MALPTTISDVSFPDQNYFVGPFKSSAGVFYTVLRVATAPSSLKVFKATDPTDSFPSSYIWNVGSNVISLWSYQVADVLHVVAQTAAFNVYYRTFNMATDTWGTEETIETIASTGDTSPIACSVAVRDDGDVVVLYQGGWDKIMGTNYGRVDYARKEGGSWTVAQDVTADTGTGVHYYAGVVVKGASDRMHFFFEKGTSVATHRSLASDNTLDTKIEYDTTVETSTNYVHVPGVSYVDTVRKVRVPYRDNSGKLSIAKFDSGANPTITTDVDASDVSTYTPNSFPAACLANDGTTLHLTYAHTTLQWLYHDKNSGSGWGTDTQLLAVTINRISSNVYDRQGQKLAYVYDDGGTVKYNELDINEAITWADTAFPDQNYWVGPVKAT